ncbi:hypothetical protein OAL66_01775 [bacterium]|nr:hypothetical protein [bacterium]
MASSTQIQTKNYFLQDEMLQVGTTPAFAPCTLSLANTIRVQVLASVGAGDITVNIGGQQATVNMATENESGDDQYGRCYIDFRGAACDDNSVSFECDDTSKLTSVYYNLL